MNEVTTSTMEAAKEPLSALIFGTILVLCITIPYFYGIGKSIATNQRGQGDQPSLIRFFAWPIGLHMLGTIGAVLFSNIWDLFFVNLTAKKMIASFWSAQATTGGNEWVNAALNSTHLMGMGLFYLVVAAPLLNFIVVIVMASEFVNFQQGADSFQTIRNNAVKIVASVGIAGLLTMFYCQMVDQSMFRGATINFKEWGNASSTKEMYTAFFKRIARMGVKGQSAAGAATTSSSSPSSTSNSNYYYTSDVGKSPQMQAYLNEK